MDANSPIDQLLLSAIETGKLDESVAADSEVATTFAAHQKLESLFGLLREPVTPPIATDESPLPTAVGRYVIRRQLGHGAFGVVYLAEDPELNRQVAIKTHRHDRFSSAAHADAVLNEARLAAKLKHPGIVPVYDIWRDDEHCYIVMAYIEGRTLEDVLHGERLTPHRAADLLAQVAEAIHYAHRQGFVHRDLKPANILVDTAGKAHVSDFGLAIAEDSQRLLANQIAGTPAYMSPEQVRGEAHRLDGRSDIWSLGVILYEALTGRHPFWRGNVVDCLDEIQHREPKPPRQIDDAIPPALEDITLHCLAKRLTDRFSTAADVAAALRAWMADGVGAGSASHGSVAGAGHGRRASWTRSPAVVATIGGAALGAAFLAAWLIHSALNRQTESGRSTLSAGATPDASAVVARIDVLIWNDFDPARRRLSLKSPDALPLRPNDQIRVEASVSQPRYLYLVWLGADGIARPVYPWVPGSWTDRPAEEKPVAAISLPSNSTKAWPLEGPTGMETLMLLARDTPLPADVNLAELCVDLPRQTSQDPRSIAWFDNGRLVADNERAPQFFNAQTVDDPVLQTQQILTTRLRPYFSTVVGVSFAFGDGSSD